MTWTTHKTYGMGASGAAVLKAAPQWIHHGCLGTVPFLGTIKKQAYRRETARDLRIMAVRGEVNDDLIRFAHRSVTYTICDLNRVEGGFDEG
jgi:hypothetical protein